MAVVLDVLAIILTLATLWVIAVQLGADSRIPHLYALAAAPALVITLALSALALCVAAASPPLVAITSAALVTELSLLRPTPRPRLGSAEPLRLLTANVLVSNPELDDLAAAIRSHNADVVVLQECQRLTPEFLASLAPLRFAAMGGYRDAQHTIPVEETWDDVVVLLAPHVELDSLRTATCGRRRFPLLALRVSSGRLNLLAAHADSPKHKRDRRHHRAQLRAIARIARATPDLVLAGDLNASARLVTLRRTPLRAPFALQRSTWPAVFPILELDHVLATPRVSVTKLERIALPGSDHLGLLATLHAAPLDAPSHERPTHVTAT